MDPCLDDCIEMAKKLKRLGIPIGLDVLPGLPHGFLSFVKVSSLSTISKKNIVPDKNNNQLIFFINSCQKKRMKVIVFVFHDWQNCLARQWIQNVEFDA